MNKVLNVGIIGAGIQGISNALFLQKKALKLQYLIVMNQAVTLHLMVMQDTSHLMHLYH